MLMQLRRIALIVALVLCTVAVAWAGGEADSAFLQGQKSLADGDLRAAVKSYGAAVKLDRDNQQYLQQYMLVRRAVALQDAVAKESDPQKWEQSALALRSFFSAQGLHAQALPLDRAMLDRSETADNALQLAETLLALERSEEAAEVLTGLDPQRATTASRAMLSVALARQGKLEQAKEIAKRVTPGAEEEPGTLYLTARMHAAVGNADQAQSLLTRCYQSVPPSRLDSLKALTRQCRDFAGLVSLASFATVLNTESKVPESKCSGGSSCSTCPMRGNCSHDASK
jgi:thioredoxin-like negative regulator of GroEL